MPAPYQIADVARSQPRRVCYDLEHQQVYVSPASARLELLLQAEHLTPQEDGNHGYKLSRARHDLLKRGNGIANAGLGLVAALALAEQGDTVELPPPKPRLAEIAGPARFDGNPHVVQLIQANRHGIIRHGLSPADVARLCIEVAENLAQARIAFVVASTAQAAALHAHFAVYGEPVTWADFGRCLNPGARLTVGTYSGLGQMEVLGDPIDVLIAPDASQAIGEVGQLAMLANGRSRLVGFLHQDKDLSPWIRDLVMAAFGPCEVTVPRLGCQYRHVAIDWLRIDGPIVPDQVSGYSLYRRGIEKHRVRNRCIADYATLIATHAAHHWRRSSTTIILVGGAGHALELAKLLPTWRLVVNEPVNLAGLSLDQCRRFEASRSVPAGEGHAIITVPALHRIDLGDIGAVIWAAGGSGLPEVPREQLICPAGEQQPLVWVDVRDCQHGKLRRLSKLRQTAYTAAGWFPVGQSPVEGRILRFLGQRPGGNA